MARGRGSALSSAGASARACLQYLPQARVKDASEELPRRPWRPESEPWGVVEAASVRWAVRVRVRRGVLRCASVWPLPRALGRRTKSRWLGLRGHARGWYGRGAFGGGAVERASVAQGGLGERGRRWSPRADRRVLERERFRVIGGDLGRARRRRKLAVALDDVDRGVRPEGRSRVRDDDRRVAPGPRRRVGGRTVDDARRLGVDGRRSDVRAGHGDPRLVRADASRSGGPSREGRRPRCVLVLVAPFVRAPRMPCGPRSRSFGSGAPVALSPFASSVACS